MEWSNNTTGMRLKFIHKTMDSIYGSKIHQLLKTRTTGNIVFTSSLLINLITFLALLIAYFGLGLMAVSAYVACVYSLILVTNLQQLFSYRKINPVNVSLVPWCSRRCRYLAAIYRQVDYVNRDEAVQWAREKGLV
jgi:hypothetical protein